MERQEDSIGLGPGALGISTSADLLDVSKPVFGSSKEPRDPNTPPKRFKSSFIFFSMEKHREVKEQMAKDLESAKTVNITKLVADTWRNISPEEKAKYEEMARKDKLRYNQEKANYKDYKGSFPTQKRRRDPDAPKRPMSAYLAFANALRAEVKAQNPECSNGEISKILSKKWKEASDDQKKRHRDEEAEKWVKYKEQMAIWKKKNDGRKRAARALQPMSSGAAKKKKKGIISDEDSSLPVDGFDDGQFPTYSSSMLDQSNPSQDEIMAASAALRGVRTGPNFFSGGSSAFAASGFDASPQQGPGTLGLLYGMGSGVNGGISQFAGGSSAVQPAVNVNGLGFGADLSGALAGRPLLDIGFPYQSYGAYGGGALGSSQAAVLMAQTAALRGTQSTAYLGFPESQPHLAQLATLAGKQTTDIGHSQAAASPAGIGLNSLTGSDDQAGSSIINY